MNFGFPQETDLHNINIDGGVLPNSNSSKIISLQLQAADTVKVTSRETYSILPYFGDIGGLYEFLSIFVGLIVSTFSGINLKAFVANKLYSWMSPMTGVREAIPNYPYLEIQHLFQHFVLCCCRSKWHRAYEEALDKIDGDLLKQFDFIRFSKRLSQHTAVLNLTLLNVDR